MLRNRSKRKNPDYYLMEKIQPRGGITFSDPKYISTGTGYETCIHIYDFPNELNDNWMAKICNIPGTVVTVDISTDNVDEVKKNINRSMKEQNERYKSATNFDEIEDAKARFNEMKRLYQEISSMGEVIKLLHIRIFVAEHSLYKLQDKIKDVMTKIEGATFKPTIFMNETKKEWKSMYRAYKKQQKEEYFFTYGQPLTSDALAAGNPFHFSSLEDETGGFLGKTPCGGNVLFNLFTKSGNRLFYNFLCAGKMGSGKSTLLKKLFQMNADLGNFVRAFDISGEFSRLTLHKGGKIIKADGSNGMQNPLEVLKGGDTEELSFTMHISKVSTMYKFWIGGQATAEEIIDFEELLREFYGDFGFEIINGKMNRQVTGLPANQYPVLSELLAYIEKRIAEMQEGSYGEVEMEVIKKEILQLNKMRKIISQVVHTYGNLFDGYSTISNILDEQIVTFDISALKELKPEIFDAQIFNLVSLCWDNCVANGKLMQKLLNEGMSIWDVVYFLILIDESHRWLNARKPYALELITIYMREARKYFGGIGMASQSIRDYVPEGSGDADVERVKLLFELTQYKFIFHQDSSVIPLLSKVFENVFTQNQILRIPKLEVGENILSIASDRNLEFKVHLTKEEERIFQGGV